MQFEVEIYLNQLAQEIKPLAEGKEWFALLNDEEQKKVLRALSTFIIQAGVIGSDVHSAFDLLAIKPTWTPCVILLKAAEKDLKGNKELKKSLAKVVALPKSERRKSFVLLIHILGVADARRRLLESKIGCDHWWHKDLSDEQVIAHLLRSYNDRSK